jgi:hypothetical protein
MANAPLAVLALLVIFWDRREVGAVFGQQLLDEALAAQRSGRLLNRADVARDAALPHATAHRYLNLVDTGCLLTRIRPFATNPNVALVKTPELLWTDCGLAAALAWIKTGRTPQNGLTPDSGWNRPSSKRCRRGGRWTRWSANCIFDGTVPDARLTSSSNRPGNSSPSK